MEKTAFITNHCRHDINGNLDQDELCTEYSLRAARNALTIQKAADAHLYDVPLE